MKRIAILGGGISGLAAAYELELARKRGAAVDWHLYEASDRLGGILETTRIAMPEGEFILEGGPDGWVSEKPWARELAIELGLEAELIYSNDATRKIYILRDDTLLAIPARMRLMVPEDLSALEESPLFSDSAKRAYADELARAEDLKKIAPDRDESVASFVLRHFGDEVLNSLAAPLLSGVFGGDVHKLSVRAVMPQFVAMEREHGSLIAGLQFKAKHRTREPQPIFTSLRRGMGSLIEALVAQLPPLQLHINREAYLMEDAGWVVMAGEPYRSYLGGLFTSYRVRQEGDVLQRFDQIILATPLDVTRKFAGVIGSSAQELFPTDASSAVLAAFTWPAELAAAFTVPAGFGFLVPLALPDPSTNLSFRPERSAVERPATQDVGTSKQPQLLACTFVDQKFPHRAPAGARILRAFFGGSYADALSTQPDEAVAAAALGQLRAILGPLPDPAHTEVRRWARSLPQYEVRHLDRIAQLESLVAATPGLHLLGNSYHGVGVPDLIRVARATARKILATL